MTIYRKPGYLLGIINGKEVPLDVGDQIVLECERSADEAIWIWQQVLTVMTPEKVEYADVPVKLDAHGKPYQDFENRRNRSEYTGAAINDMPFISSADLLLRTWRLIWSETIETHSERT